ncbi:MAG: hypothetical protein ABI599_01340 [Flavobacteriales bacterium]
MRPFIPLPFLLCASLNAQTIFAPLGAKWTYEEHYAFIPDSNIVVVESIADTVMLGRTCKVLEVTGDIYCTPSYRYVYASNDTVFFWEPVAGLFSVLHIMNAVPGQQWDMWVSAPNFALTMVAGVTTNAVSTTVISGLTLRTQSQSVDVPGMAYFGTGNVIERLGDLRYLFPWGTGACDGDYITTLRCYEDPDITWLNPQVPQCDLITGIGEHSPVSPLRIAPSLTEVGTPIAISTTDASVRSYRVTDMTGRTIATGSFAHGTAPLQLPRAGTYMVMPEPMGAFSAQRVVAY